MNVKLSVVKLNATVLVFLVNFVISRTTITRENRIMADNFEIQKRSNAVNLFKKGEKEVKIKSFTT